jgi:hypothetical protein
MPTLSVLRLITQNAMKTYGDVEARTLKHLMLRPPLFEKKTFSAHWIGADLEAVEKRKMYLSPAGNRTQSLQLSIP